MSVPDPMRDPQFYDGVILRRLAAFVIDSALILALMMIVMQIGVFIALATFGFGAPIVFLAVIATGFLYRWGAVRRYSATPGMMLTGIELRDSSGARLDHAMALLHTAAFHVVLLFPLLALIGSVVMFKSPYRRGLHDLPFGTVVINSPR